ncbi:MAG: pyrD [Deltaproteobacteria bacterium]|jgi:dihydroorotate dehydrogenase|nr:pyrD [Deltaproteobacteria bacterium]
MTLYHGVAPLLFQLDPEHAHDLAMRGLAAVEWLLASRFLPRPLTHPALSQELWGIRFPNPVGLAAGFDKDARAAHVWPLLGFGFAELGTITAAAQPGNPKPRLFRLARDRAIVNRMGFNNAGATAIAQRWGTHRQPSSIPIGINIGKSRATPIGDAVADYLRSFRQLAALADYVVINVSSPNTPGLRDLQTPAHLVALLSALGAENDALARGHGLARRPILVKIAPDLSEEALPEIVAAVGRGGASGLVATNTTTQRAGLRTPCDENGGLSGAPLRERATAVVRTLRRLAGPDLPIIGVGGIFGPLDAYEKIRAGASLVQLYTGMIFEGPRLAARVARGLVELLQRDGLSHVREAVGKDA